MYVLYVYNVGIGGNFIYQVGVIFGFKLLQGRYDYFFGVNGIYFSDYFKLVLKNKYVLVLIFDLLMWKIDLKK